MADVSELIEIVTQVRERIAVDGGDFMWTRWRTREEALADIDDDLRRLEAGELPPLLAGLFAPTASVQEHSLSNGWGEEFIALSARFDRAFAQALASSDRA
jgi:hypothetical protein